MEFDRYWTETRTTIDGALCLWVPRFFSGLTEPQIDRILQILANGKRLRGTLACLVNRSLGGELEKALPRAVALECIQSASLVHDDFVDGDTRRRDQAAQWVVEGPHRAVLIGDLIFSTAIHQMAELSREDGATIAEAVALMARGAYQEALPNPGDPPREGCDYGSIIFLKTGALFGASAKMGALSAGAASDVARTAFRYGALLGEAYQIADDLCDVVHADADDPRALIPLYLHFLGREERLGLSAAMKSGAAGRWCAERRELVANAMRIAVAERLRQAVAEVERLPTIAEFSLLHQAGERVVASMGEAGGWLSEGLAHA